MNHTVLDKYLQLRLVKFLPLHRVNQAVRFLNQLARTIKCDVHSKLLLRKVIWYVFIVNENTPSWCGNAGISLLFTVRMRKASIGQMLCHIHLSFPIRYPQIDVWFELVIKNCLTGKTSIGPPHFLHACPKKCEKDGPLVSCATLSFHK